MALDDFKRMMAMEGVVPLDREKEKLRRSAPAELKPKDVGYASEQPAPEASGYAWVTGPRARVALEAALERLGGEIRNGRRGWANGIRHNGTAVVLPASSGAASLLSAADRLSLRLMIVGGDGWTFVMHPLMGVATLDEDPT